MMQRLLLTPCALLVGLTYESLAVRIGEEAHASVSAAEPETRSLLQQRSKGKRRNRNPSKIDDWFLREHPDAAELEEHGGDASHDYDEFEERREGHRRHGSHHGNSQHAGLTEQDERDGEEDHVDHEKHNRDQDRDYAADNDYGGDYQQDESKKNSQDSGHNEEHEESARDDEEDSGRRLKDESTDDLFPDEHPDTAHGSGGDQIQEMEDRERAAQRRQGIKFSERGPALTQDYAEEDSEGHTGREESEYDYETGEHGHGHLQWEDSLLDQTSGTEEGQMTASKSDAKKSVSSKHKKTRKKKKKSSSRR